MYGLYENEWTYLYMRLPVIAGKTGQSGTTQKNGWLRRLRSSQ
jgi:hypothetical protein